jgi:hypothetical protein
MMRRSWQIRLWVWRQVARGVVLIRDVPLERDTRLNVRTPNGIGSPGVWLARTRGYERDDLRLFPPSRLSITLGKKIPILGQSCRYVLSIGCGGWGLSSNQRLCPNWGLTSKRGLRLAPRVELSTNRNLIIRCERLSNATRVGSSGERWIRPSGGGLGKCQNETGNRIVPRGEKTPDAPDGT